MKTRRRGLPQVEPPPNGNGHSNGHPVQTSTPSPATPRQDRYESAFPVKGIVESKTNPRKTFDETKLAELAESIKTKGVLEPILVRPQKLIDNLEHATVLGVVELVAGARRLRAAILAGVKTVPVRIMNLTDQEALEVQVIENLQREDLDPIEEAEGYHALLATGKYEVESLAAKLGVSPATIYGSLKLLHLPAKARDSLRAGDISVSIAQLIGRVPNVELREQAFKAIAGSWRKMTFKEAKEWIEDQLTIELKGSPFDQEDPDLTPAGRCSTCKSRTGNARHLYPEGRADICTDTACFRRKIEAHGKGVAAKYKAAGKTVIEGKAAAKLFSEYGDRRDLRFDAPFVDLAQNCRETDKLQTWGKILLPECEAQTIVAVDPKGGVHQLVPKRRAEEVLRVKFGKRASSTRGPGRSASEIFEDRVRAETRTRLMGAVASSARLQSMKLLGGTPDFLRPLTKALVRNFHWDYVRYMNKRRELKIESKHSQVDSVDAYIDTLDYCDCFSLLCELAAAVIANDHHSYENYGHGLLEAFDLDKADIEKDVRRDLKKSTPKSKASKS